MLLTAAAAFLAFPGNLNGEVSQLVQHAVRSLGEKDLSNTYKTNRKGQVECGSWGDPHMTSGHGYECDLHQFGVFPIRDCPGMKVQSFHCPIGEEHRWYKPDSPVIASYNIGVAMSIEHEVTSVVGQKTKTGVAPVLIIHGETIKVPDRKTKMYTKGKAGLKRKIDYTIAHKTDQRAKVDWISITIIQRSAGTNLLIKFWPDAELTAGYLISTKFALDKSIYKGAEDTQECSTDICGIHNFESSIIPKVGKDDSVFTVDQMEWMTKACAFAGDTAEYDQKTAFTCREDTDLKTLCAASKIDPEKAKKYCATTCGSCLEENVHELNACAWDYCAFSKTEGEQAIAADEACENFVCPEPPSPPAPVNSMGMQSVDGIEADVVCHSIGDPHMLAFTGEECGMKYQGEVPLLDLGVPLKLHTYQCATDAAAASYNVAVAVQYDDSTDTTETKSIVIFGNSYGLHTFVNGVQAELPMTTPVPMIGSGHVVTLSYGDYGKIKVTWKADKANSGRYRTNVAIHANADELDSIAGVNIASPSVCMAQTDTFTLTEPTKSLFGTFLPTVEALCGTGKPTPNIMECKP